MKDMGLEFLIDTRIVRPTNDDRGYNHLKELHRVERLAISKVFFFHNSPGFSDI